ncbi:MAG TPA: class I SAM-dependent rRNA methyltransferase [Anaerolineae bacterium]|jgi:23S rRNA (cytosine1962-C5)-methyltransferase
MPLLQPPRGSPLKLRLARNLVRSLKRGQPWVFADALRELPPAPPGTPAILLDNKKGREIARGFYDANSPLAFRACTVEPDQPLDDDWAAAGLARALALRQALFDEATTGYRLCNGEGDGLPGLICDVYGDTAVIQLDGAGPAGFWQVEGVAQWVAGAMSLRCVTWQPQSRRSRGATGAGQALVGPTPSARIPFLENNIRFTVDVVHGQKTGFYLDQRDNRRRIGRLAAGRRVLNLFGYTGGFSIYAGLNGAGHVTTVDLAEPALHVADHHWQLNGLPATAHQTIAADAFDFLETATRRKQERWDLIVVDPPAFAPSQEAVPQALRAYQKLIAASASVTAPDGLLAAASCSSHVRPDAFLTACEEGISIARRRAILLGSFGQPADHPTPLAFPEFRYLKFVLLRLE